MGDPSDLASTVSRLTALLDQYPADEDLRVILAARLERLGEVKRGMSTLESNASTPSVQ